MSKEYIDRDTVCQLIRQYEDNVCPATADAIHAVQKIYEMICSITTADVVTVAHGHWIDKYNDCYCAECSVCGEFYETADQDCVTADNFRLFCRFYKFCPNCGSKMDDEEKNG